MNRIVMLYDGYCILCRQSQRVVGWLDWLGRVERQDVQQQRAVLARFPELEGADVLGEIYIQRREGRWQPGFYGLRYLAWHLPLLWLLLPLLYLPGMDWLGPRVYRWVARAAMPSIGPWATTAPMGPANWTSPQPLCTPKGPEAVRLLQAPELQKMLWLNFRCQG
ncbi:MAG: DUF393 domain-containing protein [Anaerolineae bacterium]|nr:DUF393 domain-containing protein [Anaerolineae bacterium]